MRCMPVRCTPNSTPMTYTPVRYKSPDFPHRGAVVDLSRSEFAKYEFFALVAKWSLLRSAHVFHVAKFTFFFVEITCMHRPTFTAFEPIRSLISKARQGRLRLLFRWSETHLTRGP